MYAYSTVILNAFPLLTIDKKLSLEVTPKLERMEYSYKCCIDKEEAIVVCKKQEDNIFLCLYFGALRGDKRGALDKKI